MKYWTSCNFQAYFSCLFRKYGQLIYNIYMYMYMYIYLYICRQSISKCHRSGCHDHIFMHFNNKSFCQLAKYRRMAATGRRAQNGEQARLESRPAKRLKSKPKIRPWPSLAMCRAEQLSSLANNERFYFGTTLNLVWFWFWVWFWF